MSQPTDLKAHRRYLLQLRRPQLIKKCINQRVSTSGSKAELVKKLMNNLANNNNNNRKIIKSLTPSKRTSFFFPDNATNAILPSFRLKHKERMKQIKQKRKQKKNKKKNKLTINEANININTLNYVQQRPLSARPGCVTQSKSPSKSPRKSSFIFPNSGNAITPSYKLRHKERMEEIKQKRSRPLSARKNIPKAPIKSTNNSDNHLTPSYSPFTMNITSLTPNSSNVSFTFSDLADRNLFINTSGKQIKSKLNKNERKSNGKSTAFKRRRRDLLQLTKTQLVKKCIKYKLSTSGTKGDLVSRLMNNIFDDNTNSILSSFKLKHKERMNKIKLNKNKSKRPQRRKSFHNNKYNKINQDKIQKKQKNSKPIMLPMSATFDNPNDLILDKNVDLKPLYINKNQNKNRPSSAKHINKNKNKKYNTDLDDNDDVSCFIDIDTVIKNKNKNKNKIKKKKKIKKKNPKRNKKKKEKNNNKMSTANATKYKIAQLTELRERNDLNNYYLPRNDIQLNKNQDEINLEVYFGQLFSGLSH